MIEIKKDERAYKIVWSLVGSTALLILIFFAIKDRVLYIPTRHGFFSPESDGEFLFSAMVVATSVVMVIGYYHGILSLIARIKGRSPG